jgi:beta propeller repeat protein
MDDRNQDGDMPGNWDIYMHDLLTGEELQVSSNVSNQVYPAVYGDRIVWTDMRNEEAAIYMFELVTQDITEK